MRVFVDDDSCAGHGVCAALCPQVFVITGDGYAAATPSDVPPDLEAAVRDAAEGCPEHAVHIA